VVIANKILVTRNGRSFEIEFVVLADHYVFVVDEKSWRGRIHGSDQVWVRDDGSSERSPLNKVDYVANVMAGELRARVAHLGSHEEHFVRGVVLLSASDEPPRIRDARASDGVVLLKDAVDRLVRIDQRAVHEPIAPLRSAIEKVLVDLSDRPRFPKRINQYQIDEVVSQRPGSYVARATHDDAGVRILYVYNVAADAEARSFYLREFQAVRALSSTSLVPQAQDPIEWSDDFLVIPFAPPAGKALATFKPPETAEDFLAELLLAAKAFDGLATIHEHGVLHRAISPDTRDLARAATQPTRLDVRDLPGSAGHSRRSQLAPFGQSARSLSSPSCLPPCSCQYSPGPRHGPSGRSTQWRRQSY